MPHTTLITTDEIDAKLDANWVIADCRCDLQDDNWGDDQYQHAHIPGALFVSLLRDLSAPLTGSNGRHPLPSHDAMVATFTRLGIGPDTQVIAYDQDSGMFASRLWWMLRYAGHDAVAVLDGGWAKWIREGRPVRGGTETRPPVPFAPAWRPAMRVDLDAVAARAEDPATLLLDARAPERFEGQVEPLDRLPGHIPGAANRWYRDNLTPDNTLLPADVLRAQFTRDLRGRAPSRTVMYCGSGVSACHNLLAMDVAGLPGAQLYAGSWSEWSADPARPVETGPSTK